MKSYKRLLMSVACGVLLLGNINAQAEENETVAGADNNEFASKIASGEKVVLFKIHDITPIKNKDDIVTDCEFNLTMYNRSPNNIDSATINLTWKDTGIASVIEEEDKLDKLTDKNTIDSLNQAKATPQKVRTESVVDSTLKTSVILPQIKPFRQISLKSKIKSDRCFLMMEDVEFDFSECTIGSNTPKSASNSLSVGSGLSTVSNECQSLFRFVSPKDPEYYREFEKVSFNEEAQKKAQERQKGIDEMTQSYQQMKEGLVALTNILDSIK